MKVLINYGLVFAIILFSVYAIISVAAVKNSDTVLCIWMVCVAGYSLMNNVLMDPEQCCTLFAVWYALDVWKRRRSPEPMLPGPDDPPDPPKAAAAKKEVDSTWLAFFWSP